MQKKNSKVPTVVRSDIVKGLNDLSLRAGDVVLVHSAMRTLGFVEGGADTVVNAFLELLGDKGTLVVPTYYYGHEIEDDPIIDPARDPSEMGVITETVRHRKIGSKSTAK